MAISERQKTAFDPCTCRNTLASQGLRKAVQGSVCPLKTRVARALRLRISFGAEIFLYLGCCFAPCSILESFNKCEVLKQLLLEANTTNILLPHITDRQGLLPTPHSLRYPSAPAPG